MSSGPVQSIRVATMLAERYAALAQTGSTSIANLELTIGEAQQLYPEVWRHLDEARTALAAQGRDVAAYDTVRADELGHLGVTNVATTQSLDYLALATGVVGYKQTKTATFNAAGYRRAVEAINALMQLMPEVDWAGQAREEVREIAAAGSLHTDKWIGIAKAVAAAAVLGVVAFVVYRLALAPGAESPPPGASSQAASSETKALEAKVAARAARIGTLLDARTTRCDPAVVPELVALLREAGREPEAKAVETGRCIPVRPSCEDVRGALVARVLDDLELVRDGSMQVRCEGVAIGPPDALVPALAVSIDARAGAGGRRTVRGIAAPDGTSELLGFAASPAGAQIVAIGDLDDDGGDELVLAGDRELIVSRVAGDRFDDAPGPTLRPGCRADITIEKDFRAGRTGAHHRLVLSVPPGASAPCLASGKHYYALVDGELVETE